MAPARAAKHPKLKPSPISSSSSSSSPGTFQRFLEPTGRSCRCSVGSRGRARSGCGGYGEGDRLLRNPGGQRRRLPLRHQEGILRPGQASAPGQESRQPRRGAEIPGRLLERSTELGNIEVAVKQKEQILNNLKALNAEQEKDVQRVRQREKLLKKAELIKKKLP